MRPSDLYTSSAHIRDAFQELQTAWQEAATAWNDAVSRSFCENYMEPMGPVLKLSLDAIGRMSQLVDGMHRDCES
jgi:hypothetical protein